MDNRKLAEYLYTLIIAPVPRRHQGPVYIQDFKRMDVCLNVSDSSPK